MVPVPARKKDLYFMINPKIMETKDIVPMIKASFNVLPAIASMIKRPNRQETKIISIICARFPPFNIFLNKKGTMKNKGRI